MTAMVRAQSRPEFTATGGLPDRYPSFTPANRFRRHETGFMPERGSVHSFRKPSR